MKKTLSLLVLASLMLGISCNQDEFRTFDEQLAFDIAQIDAYLEENQIDATIDPSGLRYVIHKQGTGDTPVLSDRVNVNYEGRYLSNNQVFDANDNITFALNRLIVAWQIAIPLIQEGGSMTIYAPSGLCYGVQGVPGSIPSNANMIFDMDLNSIDN